MKQFYLSFFLLINALGFSQSNACSPNQYFAYLPPSAQTLNLLLVNEGYPEIFQVSSQGTMSFNYTLEISQNYEVSFDNNSGYTNSISENYVNRISCFVRIKSGLPNGSYSGTISIYYNGSTTPCVISLSTEVTLSNTDFSSTNFQIYPNPTSDILNFTEPTDLSLFNIQGSKISEFEQVKFISISNLPSGIYLLKTKKFGKHKIIKQ